LSASGRTRRQRLLDRLRGRPVDYDLLSERRVLSEVGALEPTLQGLDDTDLHGKAVSLRRRVEGGEALDAVAPEAFALVREAARRRLGQRPFDEQVLAGLAMHRGRVAELATGEGKTLAAVAPAFLNALAGRGMHVLTFNDYLARRDAEWMGPVYRLLGATAGSVQEGMAAGERRRAYRADVTYATAREAGFDFLRDGLVLQAEERVARAASPPPAPSASPRWCGPSALGPTSTPTSTGTTSP
jgi:preprotein translocase subunit SecA